MKLKFNVHLLYSDCASTAYFDLVSRTCRNCPPYSYTPTATMTCIDDCVCEAGFERIGDQCVGLSKKVFAELE